MSRRGIAVKAQDRRPVVEIRRVGMKFQMRQPASRIGGFRVWRDVNGWPGVREFREKIEAEGFRVEWV